MDDKHLDGRQSERWMLPQSKASRALKKRWRTARKHLRKSKKKKKKNHNTITPSGGVRMHFVDLIARGAGRDDGEDVRAISSCCVNLEEVIAAGARTISHSHF